jgi:hypothetical protein
MKVVWVVLIALGALLALGLVVFLLFRRGPDLSSYLPLKEPRLAHLDNERVLEVEFSGPADTIVQKAYGVLFKAYYSAKRGAKGPAMKPPKARYAALAELLSSPGALGAQGGGESGLKAGDWSGAVAIPVPEGFDLPEGKGVGQGMTARTAVWDYGEVAEILHLGPYETEAPTIRTLTDFISAQGLKIVGEHEEEYLRGPGMLFVAPKDYWTIIRYRVEKARNN